MAWYFYLKFFLHISSVLVSRRVQKKNSTEMNANEATGVQTLSCSKRFITNTYIDLFRNTQRLKKCPKSTEEKSRNWRRPKPSTGQTFFPKLSSSLAARTGLDALLCRSLCPCARHHRDLSQPQRVRLSTSAKANWEPHEGHGPHTPRIRLARPTQRCSQTPVSFEPCRMRTKHFEVARSQERSRHLWTLWCSRAPDARIPTSNHGGETGHRRRFSWSIAVTALPSLQENPLSTRREARSHAPRWR